MDDLLYILIGVYVLMYVTWVHYLAIMNLKRNRRKLTPFAKFWAYNAIFIGYPLDIALNLVMSVPMLDFPRELLFSAKCERLLEEGGWRGKIAAFFCRNMLDPFDPSGEHCDRPG